MLGPGNDARESEVELAVLRGAADLVNEDGRTSLGAGERAFARAGAGPSAVVRFQLGVVGRFDRWSEGRRDSRLGVSTEYLPDTVQSYATTFNQYGSWQNEPTYGYVWYPRVQTGWRPYYYGRWTSLRPWGWTWIGSDPWAWPTHHYGRWGFSAGAWFWIPGRIVGTGVGILGVRAGIRQLVSARMEQPSGVRFLERQRGIAVTGTIAGTRGPSCRITASDVASST